MKGAKRTFIAPITTAATFDAAVAALKADDNPLGATAYQTAGETIPGVVTTAENYKATIEYLDTLGKTIGTIVIDAPTRTASDDIIAEILATTAIATAYGADATADRKRQLECPPQNPRPHRRTLLPHLHQKRTQNQLLRKRHHPRQSRHLGRQHHRPQLTDPPIF